MRARLPLIFAILAVSASHTITALADKEVPTELKEVVVLGKNAWFEDGKVVFRPTKSAKNLATDATSLIDRMNTGILKKGQTGIETISGRPVHIFINGVQADEMDLSTFWPSNAVRVEYMETSDDPRFMGMTNIVNFIMKDYTYGGLTRLQGEQELPGGGDYSVASKLARGITTVNAMFRGGYKRDHRAGSDSREQYHDIFYAGSHFDRVDYDTDQDAFTRKDDMNAGFNVRQRWEKKMIKHDVAWQWTRNPGSGSHGAAAYTPAIIGSDAMISAANGLSISPMAGGQYNFFPSQKLSYSAAWRLTYSHNRNFSSFTDSGLDPIETFTREEAYTFAASFGASYRLRQNLAFRFRLAETRNVSTADYTGSTLSHQWQSGGTSLIDIYMWYQPFAKLTFGITPQLTLNDWNINHTTKEHEWLPGVDVRLNYSFNPKHGISITAWYHQRSPKASMRTDLILRQTELKWHEGNALLESNDSYWFDIDYSSFISPWFTSSVSLNCIIENDEAAIRYRSGGEGYPGVIAEYFNAGRGTTYMFQWDPSWNFLDHKLRLHASLTYTLKSYTHTRKAANWRVRPGISYDFGNFSAYLWYASPEKFPTNGGFEIMKTYHQYGLDLSYGNGNLQASLDLGMPFTAHRVETSRYRSDAYTSNKRTWRGGRYVGISLTYTLDYGKKTDPGFDIGSQNIRTTNILGSDQ